MPDQESFAEARANRDRYLKQLMVDDIWPDLLVVAAGNASRMDQKRVVKVVDLALKYAMFAVILEKGMKQAAELATQGSQVRSQGESDE